MKKNIDLTEDMIFSRVNFPADLARQEIATSTDDLDLDFERQMNAIIPEGNKIMRKKTEYYRRINNPDYCDCCGKRINLKPWDKEIGTCRECTEHYLKLKDKCPWRIA